MFCLKNFKYLAILIICFYPIITFGMQKINVADGDVIKIKISSKELTRIAVDGGRIDKLWGTSGMLETQADKKDGEIFFRPGIDAAKNMSFFLRDNYGSTYTVIAEQMDLPSQTVILMPTIRVGKHEKEKSKNRPFVTQLKELFKIMYREEKDPKLYDVKIVNKEIKLWQEANITLVKSYGNDKLTGEIFRLTNVSDKDMQLSENEFLTFRPNIVAVAILKLTLMKNEETNIYVVRR